MTGATIPSEASSPIQEFGGLPDFLIIGAQKSGTTSLYRYLVRHPQIERASRKEIHYFDFNFQMSMDWYRSFFPLLERSAADTASSGRRSLTGEATPYYLYHPHVPKRVGASLPEVKLLVVLRNPIDRAYSNYQMEVEMGHEPLSFQEALAAEPGRLRDEVARLTTDEKYRSHAHVWHSYLARGVYVDQLVRWHSFVSRERMLILKAEDLRDSRVAAFDRMLDFLELPAVKLDLSKLSNSRKYPPLELAERRRLVEYFEPHNRRLYEYLGVDFGWQ